MRPLLSHFELNNFKLYSHARLLVFLVLFELPVLGYLTYYYANYIQFFPVAIIFGLIFFCALNNFEFWILSSIIAYIPLVVNKAEGISLIDVGIALYIFIPLAIWFIKKVFVEKEVLFEGMGDVFLLIFYLLCIFSITLTILNSFDVFLWFKDMIIFSGYLFYFPVREYFRKAEEIKKKQKDKTLK